MPVRVQCYLIPVLVAALLVGDAVAGERRIEFLTDDNVTIVATVSEPRQLEIVAGSSGHGVSVFADDPTLQQRVLDWLLRTL